MSESAPHAVFLSYASQDAAAARRICDALRAAGVEVWFDQSELVGGDAWDQKIRGQIKACALFVPVISAESQARREGYFRLEWKLAAQRTQTIADGTPFLLPVVIDATRDSEALVPEEFRAVQWTRLAGGETTPAFVARVKNLLGPEVAPASSRPSEKAGQMPARHQPVGLRVPAAAWMAAIGLLVAAGWFWRQQTNPVATSMPNAGAATRPPTSEKSPALPTDKSIAVLPFANMSEDKDASAFFSDGVHEDILTNLANIREFRVVPRPSVEPYRGTKKSLPLIAQELRVAYILTGSVRRAGNQVRVSGALINARTEENVWANFYDKSLTNIFSIQTELATDIAQALKTVLSPEEKTLVARRPTESTAAYEQFLKAREVRRGFGAPEANARAMEPFLLEAVRLDPNYAAAYAELVYVYSVGGTAAEKEAMRPKAQSAVDRAVQLAQDSPEVILALGDFYLGSGDPGRAVEQYERFGRLRPKDPDYLARLAEAYQGQGSAMAPKTWEIRKQLEDVDPGNMANLYRTVNLLVTGRRYADAIAVQRRIVARLPDELNPREYLAQLAFLRDGATQPLEKFWSETKPEAFDRGIGRWRTWLRDQGRLDEAVSFDLTHRLDGDAETINVAIIHAARGDLAAARARLGDLPDRLRGRTAPGGPAANNAGSWINLGTIAGALGNREEALQCAKRALELMPASRAPQRNLARLHAWAGDKEAALAELRRFFPTGGNVHQARGHPDYFPLHGDPRFEALLNDPKNNQPLF
jgi:TolB-like protein/cytochrome c-type biogenesis protein CcmH/NrfG